MSDALDGLNSENNSTKLWPTLQSALRVIGLCLGGKVDTWGVFFPLLYFNFNFSTVIFFYCIILCTQNASIFVNTQLRLLKL